MTEEKIEKNNKQLKKNFKDPMEEQLNKTFEEHNKAICKKVE